MSKIIMLSGLPASGKSTKAEEIVAQGNWVRVNRDLLRTMLHFDKFTGINEGLTVEAEKALTRLFLNSKTNVVVDDTNLNPKNKEMWKSIADECGAKFEHINMDTPVAECITRDNDRVKYVGQSVIKKMAMQYGLIDPPVKGYVLCDLDGTLCDIEHRRHYVETDPKDWKGFFSEIHNDTPRAEVVDMVREFSNQGYDIIYVSARPVDYMDETVNWLIRHDLGLCFVLIMRNSGDRRPDTEVKQEILNKYFPDKSQIFKVIDDRPSVIRMWEANGLDVIDVGDGIDF